MVRLENLTKIYRVGGKTKLVADNMNAVFPTGRSVGLLGRNGAGKSSLLRLIAGTMAPTSGRVVSDGTVSWPVGYAGSFHSDLTGAQNVRFIARVYGVDTETLVDFVADFAELGQHYQLPFRTYSSGMRARLAFGLSMGIHFDTYLVDEITAVGDAAFKSKSKDIFLQRLETSSAIFVSHSMAQLRELCDMGAVIDDGKLQFYEDIDEAIARYNEILGVRPKPTVKRRR
jgi:capsular polysaccharide transport system ATP-binding protein